MESKIYRVMRIEGEYAYLADEAAADGDELFIAMALLPFGIDVGSLLRYENLEFTVV